MPLPCTASYFGNGTAINAQSLSVTFLPRPQFMLTHSSTIFSSLNTMIVSTDASIKPRSSRRLFSADPSTKGHELAPQLTLPRGCEVVANTFVVFQWSTQYCVLQTNMTMYCWGRRRSGALEHVLDKYGLTASPKLYHINGKEVSDEQWSWLKQVFFVVHRLFDELETGDTMGKLRWINIMECSLVYEVMRRECYHYRKNLYPKGSVLTSFLKHHGVEVEAWYTEESMLSAGDRPTTPPPPLLRSQTPPSGLGLEGSGRNSGSSSAAVGASSEQINGLADREWLSDVHIANLMFLLLCGQLVLPLEMRDLFQCLYPMTDQVLEQMLQRADPGSLLMHAKSGHGVTLIFVNPSNNHWRLVVLDGLHQLVTLCDPLGTSLPSSLVAAIVGFVGAGYRVTDARSCVQAESWNCGIWTLCIASRYITAVVEHVSQSDAASFFFQPWTAGDDFTVLDAHSTTSQRHQNRAFAGELRSQYSTLLADAHANGRLLYTHDDAVRAEDVSDEGADSDEGRHCSPFTDSDEGVLCLDSESSVVRAGTASSAVRRRRFIDRPLSELVWIDLTDGMGTVEAEDEEEIEQTYDDLCDQYIEFRDDNANNSCAAALRYSLPAKLQSDELREQIVAFREYRRQRFSLFRKGPLVEESTISGNISAIIRFLGYLHYEQASEVENAALDMSVFALPNISFLVLDYVEWLEQRRGNKARAADDTTFQSVSCATVANYLNGLVSIVKFQLRHDLHLRDPLLDQLRNLRSQAESYSMTQKKYEKVHPQWCSWQDLQVAREKCRSAFDKLPVGGGVAHLLHLREVCLLGFFTICPPPRCSIVRLLEWDRTLIQDTKQRWVVDLTDISHAASRHKTHKRKGAMLLPLPKALYPYLTRLRELVPRGDAAVFPAGLLSRRTPTSSSPFLGPTPFTSFVKATFRTYTDTEKSPNPSLLRSIFTTWLYGLRYDTEDSFLQEIKMSSAKWKAHTELVAGTVYNKELIYQQQQFAQLLIFCESYSERYAYDRSVSVPSPSEKAAAEEASGQRRSCRKRNREVAENKESQVNESDGEDDEEEYVVEALLRIRENDKGEKQVQVRWEGYRRETWEPYESIKQQLPELTAELEGGGLKTATAQDEKTVREFLTEFIARHQVDRAFRWRPDQLNVLELAAAEHRPPIKLTAEELRRRMMGVVNEA